MKKKIKGHITEYDLGDRVLIGCDDMLIKVKGSDVWIAQKGKWVKCEELSL